MEALDVDSLERRRRPRLRRHFLLRLGSGVTRERRADVGGRSLTDDERI